MTTPSSLSPDVRAALSPVPPKASEWQERSDVLLRALIAQAEQIEGLDAAFMQECAVSTERFRLMHEQRARAESAERELATAKAEVEALRRAAADPIGWIVLAKDGTIAPGTITRNPSAARIDAARYDRSYPHLVPHRVVPLIAAELLAAKEPT